MSKEQVIEQVFTSIDHLDNAIKLLGDDGQVGARTQALVIKGDLRGFAEALERELS